MSDDIVPAEYKTPEGLRTLANYLRTKNGVKGKSGIEHEKRIDYFRGRRRQPVERERRASAA
jgi:hypothetical protein